MSGTGLVLAGAVLGWIAGAAGNWISGVTPDLAAKRAGVARPLAWREAISPGMVVHSVALPWHAFRKGACPHCGRHVPMRAAFMELGGLILFAGAAVAFQNDLKALLIAWLYAGFFLAVTAVDLERRRVLNVMLIPGALVGFTASAMPGMHGLASALLGGLAGLGLFLLIALLGRGKMGAGDVKLAGVIGIMLGFPVALTALVIGIILGGVGAITLIVAKRATLKGYIAYAPYLCLGALIVLPKVLGH